MQHRELSDKGVQVHVELSDKGVQVHVEKCLVNQSCQVNMEMGRLMLVSVAT